MNGAPWYERCRVNYAPWYRRHCVAIDVAIAVFLVLLDTALTLTGGSWWPTHPTTLAWVMLALQAAAVNGELRQIVAGVGAARLAPNLLAETVGVKQFVGADGDGVEPLQ